MRLDLTHEDLRSPYRDECQSEQELIDQLQASMLQEANERRKVNARSDDAKPGLSSHRDELLAILEQLSSRRHFSARRGN